MCKPSLKRLIAAIVIFAVGAFCVTCFPARMRYLIFALMLTFFLVQYLIQQYSKTGLGRENQLYEKLLQKSRGDRQLVERLIEYERRRSPNSSRTDLLQTAIYRWERDRR